MARILSISSAVIIFLLTIVTVAFAEPTYQWKDGSGRIVFGSKPPADAKKVEQVDGKSFSKYSSKKFIKAYEGYTAAANVAPQPKPDGEIKEEELPVKNDTPEEKPTVGDPAEWETTSSSGN